VERAGSILEVFELLIVPVGLLGPIHGGKGVVGSSLSARLSTLIAPRVVASVVLLSTWESLVSTFFSCNHLLYYMLEIFSGL
jgi:hypothetical protein